MIARSLLIACAMFALAACSSVAPDKPVRATTYDFGPPPAAASSAAGTAQPAIVLADPEAASSLETTALLYRLAYADPHQLLPYAHARWSAPPQRLVRQRLRDILGRDRAVLDQTESASLARNGSALPRTLRIDVEEFSHVFESATQSFGVLRVRATLTENTSAGERLVAQRVFDERVPAPTQDAPGGVHALAEATDAAAQALTAWIAQPR